MLVCILVPIAVCRKLSLKIRTNVALVESCLLAGKKTFHRSVFGKLSSSSASSWLRGVQIFFYELLRTIQVLPGTRVACAMGSLAQFVFTCSDSFGKLVLYNAGCVRSVTLHECKRQFIKINTDRLLPLIKPHRHSHQTWSPSCYKTTAHNSDENHSNQTVV